MFQLHRWCKFRLLLVGFVLVSPSITWAYLYFVKTFSSYYTWYDPEFRLYFGCVSVRCRSVRQVALAFIVPVTIFISNQPLNTLNIDYSFVIYDLCPKESDPRVLGYITFRTYILSLRINQSINTLNITRWRFYFCYYSYLNKGQDGPLTHVFLFKYILYVNSTYTQDRFSIVPITCANYS